jgi:hypothetical protein
MEGIKAHYDPNFKEMNDFTLLAFLPATGYYCIFQTPLED